MCSLGQILQEFFITVPKKNFSFNKTDYALRLTLVSRTDTGSIIEKEIYYHIYDILNNNIIKHLSKTAEFATKTSYMK